MERHIVYNYSGFKKSPRQVYRNPHLNDGAPLQVKISSARWSQRGWITSAIVHGTATPTPAWRRISPKGAIPPGPRSHMCWSLALKNCLLLAGGCFKATIVTSFIRFGAGICRRLPVCSGICCSKVLTLFSGWMQIRCFCGCISVAPCSVRKKRQAGMCCWVQQPGRHNVLITIYSIFGIFSSIAGRLCHLTKYWFYYHEACAG